MKGAEDKSSTMDCSGEAPLVQRRRRSPGPANPDFVGHGWDHVVGIVA